MQAERVLAEAHGVSPVAHMVCPLWPTWCVPCGPKFDRRGVSPRPVFQSLIAVVCPHVPFLTAGLCPGVSCGVSPQAIRSTDRFGLVVVFLLVSWCVPVAERGEKPKAEKSRS
jgi:hypothetical protein